MPNDPTEKAFDAMLEDIENKADALDDEGHKTLVTDIENLLDAVKAGKYHDFHRNGEAAPKLAFLDAINGLKDRMIDGKYDN